MATLTFTFSTGSVTLSDLNEALAIEWGYQAFVADPATPGQSIPNPQTKAEYNRQYIARLIKASYRNGKRKPILAAAELSVPDVTIT